MDPATFLFTIGYQGRTPAHLVLRLREARVLRVLDVRASPRSPRPGFSKAALSRSFERAGLEYAHVGEAGNPFLEQAATDVAGALAAYRDHLAARPEIVRGVLEAIGEARCALLCAEADARRCHRSVLADALVAAAPGLKVVHL